MPRQPDCRSDRTRRNKAEDPALKVLLSRQACGTGRSGLIRPDTSAPSRNAKAHISGAGRFAVVSFERRFHGSRV